MARDQGTPDRLTADATFEKKAVHGSTHRYEAVLNEGDFLQIRVSQEEILTALTVKDPDDRPLHKIFLPDTDPLPQSLLFVAPMSGRYAIEIRFERPLTGTREGVDYDLSAQAESTPFKYTLHVVALRPARPDDRVRAGWFSVLERADALVHRESLDALRDSLPLFREAAAGWRATGDVDLEAVTLESAAKMTSLFTQFGPESVAARERLAEVYSQMREQEWQVINWRLLAVEYEEGGRLADAKQAMSRSLDLANVLGFRAAAAVAQWFLSAYELDLGNYDRARELAEHARDLAAHIPDHVTEARAIWNLAQLDELAGDIDAAIARNLSAFDLASGNMHTLSRIATSLGFNYLSRGDLDQAESRFEARLAMSRQTVQRDQEALTRLGLADVVLARGNRNGARQMYEKAASQLEAGYQRYRCIAEQRLGRLDVEDGQLDQARVRFEKMAGIARQYQAPLCDAEAHAGLSDVAARRGDLETADTEARRVVELTEGFGEAAVNPESRALGFGRLAPSYERAIEISMRRADGADSDAGGRALMINEQALARGLLDRVAESHVDLHARLPANLADERQRVRERWRARLAELEVATRLHPDAPGTLSLVDETRALEVQVRDLEARVDAADPRHATFLRPRPLDVPAIQALLDDHTLLLEYALGDAHSYLWVVSHQTMRVFTLAPRLEIETLARRVHEQLTLSPGASAPSATSAEAIVASRQALSRLVIAPAASQIAGQRLVLVLPGALSLVPFAVLPDTSGVPLIAQHELVQIPSATTLGAMRALTAGRPRPEKTAAVFADPIFELQDPRVPRGSSTVHRKPAMSGPRAAGLALSRLPFSRTEAQEIAALAPDSVSVFLGFDATRERAIGSALANYRFVHFATHGVVNQTVPSLSSVVLSLVDRSGRRRDGFVMLPDIYDMTLNADVVVLSGCQTALGKEIRGEGPIGLARGFMYAGVPRVVASLWQVDDLATAELMKRFYRGVLITGLTPAAALRAAQRDLAATWRWRSPYYWAPFVLQGDWR